MLEPRFDRACVAKGVNWLGLAAGRREAVGLMGLSDLPAVMEMLDGNVTDRQPSSQRALSAMRAPGRVMCINIYPFFPAPRSPDSTAEAGSRTNLTYASIDPFFVGPNCAQADRRGLFAFEFFSTLGVLL